eukprot:TRINITY_DN781_c1_g1_i1.p1 TRINITY_DN781_c1_g1~~TRINITY_DN781_c1_g1_i1.p1  ORF type:complete len:217 (-),score=42.51 TRINITY_DN781_c1_g1_i1:312-872(-)
MAPRKGETFEEREMKNTVRASVFRKKTLYNRVLAALKRRPDLLGDVERTLEGLGAFEKTPAKSPRRLKRRSSDESAVSTKDAPKEPKEETPAASSADGATSYGVSECAFKSENGPSETKVAWDRNVTTYGAVSVNLNSQALSAAEPAVFTPANLGVVVKRGGREAAQRRLAQFIELIAEKAGNIQI